MLLLGTALTLGFGVWYRRWLPATPIELGWRGVAAALLMVASNFGFVGAMMNASVANALLMLATILIFGALHDLRTLADPLSTSTAKPLIGSDAAFSARVESGTPEFG